jgi:hypothetical protein
VTGNHAARGQGLQFAEHLQPAANAAVHDRDMAEKNQITAK